MNIIHCDAAYHVMPQNKLSVLLVRPIQQREVWTSSLQSRWWIRKRGCDVIGHFFMTCITNDLNSLDHFLQLENNFSDTYWFCCIKISAWLTILIMQGTDICQLKSLPLWNSALKVLCWFRVCCFRNKMYWILLNLYCGLFLEVLFDFTMALLFQWSLLV